MRVHARVWFSSYGTVSYELVGGEAMVMFTKVSTGVVPVLESEGGAAHGTGGSAWRFGRQAQNLVWPKNEYVVNIRRAIPRSRRQFDGQQASVADPGGKAPW